MLGLFRFWARIHVLHLEEEVTYLRAQLERERQRAEYAIDELLRVRVGAGPVSQPTPRESTAEATVERLLRDSEWAAAGATE